MSGRALIADAVAEFLSAMPYTTKSRADHWRSYLREFVSLCDSLGELDVSSLGPDLYARYAESIAATSGRRTVSEKLTVIRKMCRFLASKGVRCIEPVIPKCPDDFSPYVYSDDELLAIAADADRFEGYAPWRNRWICHEYPIIIRLLMSAGLRCGEVVAIRYGDVDWENGVITVKCAKGNKERLVPLHPSMFALLSLYWRRMGFPSEPGQLIFPGKALDAPLTAKNVYSRFRFGRERTGINVPGRKWHERGACVHSLRHTFALNSLKGIKRQGKDPQLYAPFLSAYLGHVSPEETEKYLRFDWEMYPESLSGFDEMANGIIGGGEDEDQ